MFGILKFKSIDLLRTKILIDLAMPMQCVFHMAFDEVDDYEEAIE